MSRLYWRATIASLLLPGVVAFAVPLLLLAPSDRSFDWLSLIPLGIGVALLLWCVREFYVSGRGTLAPWDPPPELVTTGLYRLSRNPMYVAVVLVLVGWAIAFHSWALAIYALAVAGGFHLRVLLGEEPWLARTHGEKWARYKAVVPRWVGRIGTTDIRPPSSQPG